MQICNIRMFESSLKRMNRRMKIYKVYQKDAPDAQYRDVLHTTYDEIISVYREQPGVKMMYSCNARGSMTMAKVIKDLGLAGIVKMVGNDVFKKT